jgi:hypothetical protein
MDKISKMLSNSYRHINTVIDDLHSSSIKEENSLFPSTDSCSEPSFWKEDSAEEGCGKHPMRCCGGGGIAYQNVDKAAETGKYLWVYTNICKMCPTE